MSISSSSSLLLLFSVSICCFVVTSKGDFNTDTKITWGDGRAKITEGGKALTLSIDKKLGSGFQSKKDYLFARFDVEMKLIPGNAAGLVTTFYLSSLEGSHDEVDMEFLGNVTGEPYTLHTNIYAQGEGHRERGFHLWFDPSAKFHQYSIVWNPERIIFMVDNKAVRVHENLANLGVPFPAKQPMWLIASLWNGDQWATQKGRIKANWTDAPYTAHYRNLVITKHAGNDQTLTNLDEKNIRSVQDKFMIYDYCDYGVHPLECEKQNSQANEKPKNSNSGPAPKN